MSTDTETIKMGCEHCGGRHIVYDEDRGETFCRDCGTVQKDSEIDQGADFRAFDPQQIAVKDHFGAPMDPRIHDKGLSTYISDRNVDAYGRPIPSRNRAGVNRLRKWQKRIRVQKATDRNLVRANDELDRIEGAMNMSSDIRTQAALIYRSAVKNKLIRGRSINGILSAALYAACRKCGVARTLDEIAKHSNVTRKEIGRDYRFVARALKLKITPTEPEEYLDRFCSTLKLNFSVKAKAREILREANRAELTSGRAPTGVAAAAIYMASILMKTHRTQSEVAMASGVTEVTIRNRYKEMSEVLGIDLNI